MAQKILCYTCVGRRTIPGDCHIRCGPRTDSLVQENPLVQAFSILGSVGRGPLAGVANWMNFNPGFPEPVTECEFYDEQS
jgi:hypothetical protein